MKTLYHTSDQNIFFVNCLLEIIKHIEKAKKKDQIAFTFLLDFYWNDVYGFMLTRTENETDAEDITIETFAKAFDKICLYNSEYQFNTWLIAIGVPLKVVDDK